VDQDLRVECHCGWNVTGSRERILEETRAHVMKVHWTDADDEDILEMAVPVASS